LYNKTLNNFICSIT